MCVFAKLLAASIAGVAMPAKPAPVMDLSKIDFEALGRRFKQSKHRNTDPEVLKAAIRAMLERLILLNKTRADFAWKFEELIESYDAGSRNIEELFQELLELSRNLSEEQKRHVRENMTEEELVIFDILRAHKRGEEFWIEMLGRPVPAINTVGGVRAVAGSKAIAPEGVNSYVESKFGDDLTETRTAMLALAKQFDSDELRRKAFRLWEQFRPEIPEGVRGWGAKGELDLGFLRKLAAKSA